MLLVIGPVEGGVDAVVLVFLELLGVCGAAFFELEVEASPFLFLQEEKRGSLLTK